jgi:Cdc6-like AAA superfamily ATPase
MGKEEKLQIIASTLTPVRPIRSNEFLRGRQAELEKLHRELTYFDAVPFIYGPRGVGKTSLARTAAQLVNSSSSEHIYAACAPKSEFLTICKEIAESLIEHIYKSDSEGLLLKRIEVELSLAPAIRTTFENRDSEIPPFETVNQAFRVIRQLDSLLPNTMKIVVVIDELEELRSEDKGDLADKATR